MIEKLISNVGDGGKYIFVVNNSSSIISLYLNITEVVARDNELEVISRESAFTIINIENVEEEDLGFIITCTDGVEYYFERVGN